MESIYKSRGFASCLKQGFVMVLANPLKMIKVMWWWILINAIVDVSIGLYSQKFVWDIINGKLVVSSLILYYAVVIGALLLMVLLGVFAIVYFSKYVIRSEEKKFKVKKDKIFFKNFWSFLGVFIMSGILGGLLCLIPYTPCLIGSTAHSYYILSEQVYHDSTFFPTSAYVAMFVINVVALSIMEYLGLVVPASMVYKYGSIVYNQQIIKSDK